MRLPEDNQARLQARRFTDEDLRREPELLAKAVRWAFDYRGEWDIMVAACELVRTTGTLPVTVARTVLNAMRADPRAYLPPFNLPGEPPPPPPPLSEPDEEDEPGFSPRVVERERQRRRRLVVVPDPPARAKLPLFVWMKAQCKGDWGITTGGTINNRQTPVLHVINHNWDATIWRRSEDSDGWPVDEPLRPSGWRLRWVCGGRPSQPTVFIDKPTDYRECRTCAYMVRRQKEQNVETDTS